MPRQFAHHQPGGGGRRPRPIAQAPCADTFLGAAVIPFAVADDRLWVLLGDERASGEWAPFGGRAERGESPAQTALRELFEESLGVLGRPEHIAERGRGWWQRPLHVDRRTGFCTFAVPVPFGHDQRRTDPLRFQAERKRVEDQLRGTADGGPGGGSPFLDKQSVYWADADQVDQFVLRPAFSRDWPAIHRELRRRTDGWRRLGGRRNHERAPSPPEPARRPRADPVPSPPAASGSPSPQRSFRPRGLARSRSPSRRKRRRRSPSRDCAPKRRR